MRRREFITLLTGTVAVWPLAARAQQGERMRRIGIIMPYVEGDPLALPRVAALRQGLQELGWIEGRNIKFDYRWPGGDAERTRVYAVELAALAPDIIFTSSNSTLGSLLQASRTVPIVFANVTDPVGAGFVDSLSRPGGNATGFMQSEYSVSGKWLELLKELSPGVTRVAVIRDAAIAAGIGQFGAIQSVAPPLGVEVSAVNVRDPTEIERAVAAFARSSNGGMIVTQSSLALAHLDLIVRLAAQHKLPAVYFFRGFVVSGGLASYSANFIEQYRRAAAYVDRILKGEKPADLPVQAPTKYELAINLKAAKALRLAVPPALLVRADEVIE